MDLEEGGEVVVEFGALRKTTLGGPGRALRRHTYMLTITTSVHTKTAGWHRAFIAKQQKHTSTNPNRYEYEPESKKATRDGNKIYRIIKWFDTEETQF